MLRKITFQLKSLTPSNQDKWMHWISIKLIKSYEISGIFSLDYLIFANLKLFKDVSMLPKFQHHEYQVISFLTTFSSIKGYISMLICSQSFQKPAMHGSNVCTLESSMVGSMLQNGKCVSSYELKYYMCLSPHSFIFYSRVSVRNDTCHEITMACRLLHMKPNVLFQVTNNPSDR